MTETVEKTRTSKGISIIDEGFVRNRTANFHLSVQVGMDGFSHCIFDIKNNRYIALETFSFNGVHSIAMLVDAIHELILQNDTLNNIFKSVQVGIVNERSTLIPNALFEKGKEAAYLAFNHFTEKNENVSYYDMKSIEAKNIFALPEEITIVFRKYFHNVKFNHHSSPLLESLLTSHKNVSEKQLFVHVQASHFEIVVIKGKELLFYNSFKHQTSEDFIYYLLFVCEQLKLNPESIELFLLGEVEKNSALYFIIYKYIRNVKFGTRSENFGYARGFTDVPAHFHYNLLNQYLCV